MPIRILLMAALALLVGLSVDSQTLSQPPESGAVEGVVANVNNEAVANATVILKAVDATRAQRFTTFTGSDGRFVFRNVPSLVYTAQATPSGYRGKDWGGQTTLTVWPNRVTYTTIVVHPRGFVTGQ